MTGLCNIMPIAPMGVADFASALCVPVRLLPVGGTSFLLAFGNLTDE